MKSNIEIMEDMVSLVEKDNDYLFSWNHNDYWNDTGRIKIIINHVIYALDYELGNVFIEMKLSKEDGSLTEVIELCDFRITKCGRRMNKLRKRILNIIKHNDEILDDENHKERIKFKKNLIEVLEKELER